MFFQKYFKSKSRLLLESLEHRLLLSGYGDDHGDYTYNATALYPPDADMGNIGDYGFDRDVFSFYAIGGASYGFAAGNGTLGSISLDLVTNSGSVIMSNSSYYTGGAASLGWTCLYSGTYYLAVDSPFYNVGSYGIAVSVTYPVDDHGDSSSSATSISVNSWRGGEIETSLDQDYFKFYADAGYQYEIDTSLGSLTNTYLWLYDSNGTTVISSNDDHDGLLSSHLSWTAPSSGYRYVMVEPSYAGRDYYGTYSVRVTEIDTDDHGDSPSAATLISANSWYSGNIELSGDQDYFKFYATAGNKYDFDTGLGTLTDTYLWLFDSNGISVIKSNDDYNGLLSSHLSWTAPSSGYRYVMVEPSYLGTDYSGTYNIIVNEIASDDYGNMPASATTITLCHEAFGTWETQGDKDVFRFSATAGNNYIIRVAAPDFPSLKIFGSDQTTILYQASDTDRDTLIEYAFVPAQTGQYYLELSTPYALTSGSYALSVTDQPSEWTFMVYIDGDNNLEPCLRADFEEMIVGAVSGSLDTRVNLVVQVDGSSSVTPDDWWYSGTARFTFSPIPAEQYLGEMNMADPSTLIDFVNDTINQFPASHYALVLWDHGGQFAGVCSDTDTAGNPDLLTMSDFSTFIETVPHKLDIVGFNACLMAGFEPAYQLKDLADIYIASEPSEYGNNWEGSVWNYKNIFNYLFSNPAAEPLDLASVIVNSYTQLPFNWMNDAISATDLNLMDTLASRINDLSQYMIYAATPDDWSIFRSARNAALKVAEPDMGLYSDLCDLGDLMVELSSRSTNSSLLGHANNIIATLSDMILYNWHDTGMADATGLSIYLPAFGGHISSLYDQNINFLANTAWDDFVNMFVTGINVNPDILAPSAPGVPDLDTGSDTGVLLDSITKDSTTAILWEASSDDCSGIFGYQYQLDGCSWSEWIKETYVTLPETVDGLHTIRIRAKDRAGNIGPETENQFTIDTSIPELVSANFSNPNNVSVLELIFDEEINIDAISANSLALFFNGQIINWANSIVKVSGTRFKATFPPIVIGGNYEIKLVTSIADIAGNSFIPNNSLVTFSHPTQVFIGPNNYSSIAFVDADGTRSTIRLLNGGKATISFSGTSVSTKPVVGGGILIAGQNIALEDIKFSSGNRPTSIMISGSGGDGKYIINNVSGDSLQYLIATNSILTGSVDLTGSIGTVMLGDMKGSAAISTHGIGIGTTIMAGNIDHADLAFAGKVAFLTVAKFNAGSLTAESIGTILIRGGAVDADFTATEGDIATIMVSGKMTSVINAAQSVMTIMARGSQFAGTVRAGNKIGTFFADSLNLALLSAARDISTINITKDITDSYILAGYDIGTDCMFGLQQPQGGDQLMSGNVGMVITGGTFARSFISAGFLPESPSTGGLPLTDQVPVNLFGTIKFVRFAKIDPFASYEFGLYALNNINAQRISPIGNFVIRRNITGL